LAALAERFWRRRIVLLFLIPPVLVLMIAGLATFAGALILFACVAAALAAMPTDEPRFGGGSRVVAPNGEPPVGARRFAAALPDPCFILG
jgi:hypothetical protein